MTFERRPARGAAPLLTRLLRARRPRPADAPALADPARVHRILAIKSHDQLGDFLLATPALAALRARYPAARITLIAREFLAPLATRQPDVDEVLVLPRVPGPVEAMESLSLQTEVSRLVPDLCFVLNSVSRSRSADALAALSRAACVVGRSRVGDGPVPPDAPAAPLAVARAAPRDDVYDLDLEVASGSDHQTERVLDLVRWTGASADPARLRLALSEHERAQGRARLEAAWQAARLPALAGDARGAGARVRWVGLHPGAANLAKCWPLERFVELGLALAHAAHGGEERRLVIFDSPRERGRATAVHAGLLAHGVDAAFVPAGALDEFIANAAPLDVLVCNDSGVMHIAAALGVPTVSFHAIGRPAEWAPRGGRGTAFHADRAIATIPVAPAVEAAERVLAG